MNKRVLIIDGDIAIFRNAAVIEKRSVLVRHLPSGRSKVFKNRTEFKELLKSQNREYVELDYVIEDQQEAQDPVVSFRLVKSLFDKLESRVFADQVEVYVGNDEPTFRELLPLPTPYKNNRSTIKPLHLKATKAYVKKHYGFSTFPGLETDDVVTIRCYEELAKGNIPILATIDKDSCQTQGVMYLDWVKNESGDPVLIPDLGEKLERPKTSKITGWGLRFLAYQMLAGDPTDTYQPYELSKVKYGPMKAFDAVNQAETKEQLFEIIENEYKRLYPDEFDYVDCHGAQQSADWQDMLSLYFKCAYMKRSWDDPSDYWIFKEKQLEN